MALISLEDAKNYLRVDTADDDGLISALLLSAGRLCADVARLTPEQWEAVNADGSDSDNDGDGDDTDSGDAGNETEPGPQEEAGPYSDAELARIRDAMKVAVYFTLAYFYEHREAADHHALTMTLRALLFSVREGVW